MDIRSTGLITLEPDEDIVGEAKFEMELICRDEALMC